MIDDTDSNSGKGHRVETNGELVERAMSLYESMLVGYAKTFIKDADYARDIVQDTFVRLYHQDVSKMQGGLKAWLFTVCRNRALDIIRKEKRIVNIDEEQLAAEDSGVASPHKIISDDERVRLIKTYINKLPENQAKVILMKFEYGYSYQEICDKTDLSNGNVGFLIHTGMKKLRSIIPSELR